MPGAGPLRWRREKPYELWTVCDRGGSSCMVCLDGAQDGRRRLDICDDDDAARAGLSFLLLLKRPFLEAFRGTGAGALSGDPDRRHRRRHHTQRACAQVVLQQSQANKLSRSANIVEKESPARGGAKGGAYEGVECSTTNNPGQAGPPPPSQISE